MDTTTEQDKRDIEQLLDTKLEDEDAKIKDYYGLFNTKLSKLSYKYQLCPVGYNEKGEPCGSEIIFEEKRFDNFMEKVEKYNKDIFNTVFGKNFSYDKKKMNISEKNDLFDFMNSNDNETYKNLLKKYTEDCSLEDKEEDIICGAAKTNFSVVKQLKDSNLENINVIRIPIIAINSSIQNIFNKILLKSQQNSKIPTIVRINCPNNSNHMIITMFYNEKATIIDSSDWFKHTSLYICNKKYFNDLAQDGKLTYMDKQLQKDAADYKKYKQSKSYNPRGYNFRNHGLGNCWFLSAIFMKVLVEKIDKINKLCKDKHNNNIIDILQQQFLKYSGENTINNNNKNIEYLKESIIDAYIKSRYFDNDVHKTVNKIFKEYIGENIKKQIYGEEVNRTVDDYCYYPINDERYCLYKLNIYNLTKQTKRIEFFNTKEELNSRITELHKSNNILLFQEKRINTYITNINEHSLETIEYKYDFNKKLDKLVKSIMTTGKSYQKEQIIKHAKTIGATLCKNIFNKIKSSKQKTFFNN